jgi:type I restriction enzyme S subunit
MNAEGLLERYRRIADAPGAIVRLRRLVLDLAVRGKLLEQQQEDEPSPDLLPLVVEVTADQVALPRGWYKASVGKVLEFKYGKGLKASERLDTGPIPVYGSNGIVGYTDQPLTTRSAVIVGRKGSAGALNLCEGGSWTTDVAYFVEAPTYFDIQFLKLALEALGLDKLGKGVKPGLSRSDAYEQIVLVPPLPEQHRIVAKVDELMALCDQLEAARAHREASRDRLAAASLARLNAPDPGTFPADARFALDTLPALTTRPDQLKRLRQTILNLAVRGKLLAQDPNSEQIQRALLQPEKKKPTGGSNRNGHNDEVADRTVPYEVPGNWIWATTAELCIEIVDCPHSTPAFTPSGIACLDTNSIKSGGLIPHKLRYVSESTYQERIRRLTPMSGDIIFAREGSVGESVVVPEGIQCCMGQRVMLFRPSSVVLPTYFQLAISEPSSLSRLMERHKGIGAKHVNVSDMRQALIPVPPLAEQHRIVAKIDDLMALCEQLEASLTTREAIQIGLLDALLHKALAPAPAPTASIEHPRAAVSGYVISRLASKRTFGRTAHMKHLYLAESRLGLNLGGRYMREAAGPLDTGIYELEKQAEAADWYTHGIETLPSGNEKVSYVPGKAIRALAEEGIAVLGPSREEMDRLIHLMGGLKTEQVEIIATLFAAWNDALLDGQTPDNDWIIKEVREHWHVSKQRFKPTELMTWLGWMRQNDVVPLGHPPHTMHQTTMEL